MFLFPKKSRLDLGAFCNMPSRCRGEAEVLLYLYPTLVLEWDVCGQLHTTTVYAGKENRYLLYHSMVNGGVISVEVK